MKTLFPAVILLSAALAWAEPTGVQAVPSDQIKYPDASEVLNKADTKTKSTLPVNKLVAAKPVPAQAVPVTNSTAAVPASTSAGGWYLKWSLADEAAARSWAGSLGVPADVSAEGTQWQVLAGPLNADSLKLLSAQTGKAVLVRR